MSVHQGRSRHALSSLPKKPSKLCTLIKAHFQLKARLKLEARSPAQCRCDQLAFGHDKHSPHFIVMQRAAKHLRSSLKPACEHQN